MKKKIGIIASSIVVVLAISGLVLSNNNKEAEVLKVDNTQNIEKIEEVKINSEVEQTPKEVIEVNIAEQIEDNVSNEPVVTEPIVNIMTRGDVTALPVHSILSAETRYNLTLLRFSPQSVYTALINSYDNDSSNFIKGNEAQIAESCAQQVISAIKAANEAGQPYDFRTFVCSI